MSKITILYVDPNKPDHCIKSNIEQVVSRIRHLEYNYLICISEYYGSVDGVENPVPEKLRSLVPQLINSFNILKVIQQHKTITPFETIPFQYKARKQR